MAKGYFIDSQTQQQYFGYDVLQLSPEYKNVGPWAFKCFRAEPAQPDDKIIFDSGVYTKICTLSNGVKPPKGSKVYLTPGGPYANADVRKNYNITYKEESADYIIVDANQLGDYKGQYCLLLIPSLKRAVVYNTPYKVSKQDTENSVIELLKTIYTDEMLDTDMIWMTFTCYKYKGIRGIDEILNGTSSQKCALFSSLDLSTGNEVTIDAMRIVKQAATASWSAENENKCALAIQTFNNMSWRDYPGTMCRFNYYLTRLNTTFREMKRHSSRFTKPVKEFLNLYNYGDMTEFRNENDYNLWLTFLKGEMNLEETRFAKMGNINNKLRNERMDESLFYQTFSCITQIKAKTYEDYLSEKQV